MVGEELLACVVFEDSTSDIEPFVYNNNPEDRRTLEEHDYRFAAAKKRRS